MLTQRLENVRQQLNAQGIDCLALVPGFNLRYLTGMDFMLLERPLRRISSHGTIRVAPMRRCARRPRHYLGCARWLSSTYACACWSTT
jgi:hypothetical protein